MPSYQKEPQELLSSPFRKGLSLLVEIWITAVIVVFLIVRVLGSNTAKHLLHFVGR
jgi:hypothetical protein